LVLHLKKKRKKERKKSRGATGVDAERRWGRGSSNMMFTSYPCLIHQVVVTREKKKKRRGKARGEHPAQIKIIQDAVRSPHVKLSLQKAATV